MKRFPKRVEGLKTRLLPDGSVALHPAGSSELHTLSPVGGIVWELCDGQLTVEQIIGRIRALTGRNEDVALQEEVENLLQSLSQLSMILFSDDQS